MVGRLLFFPPTTAWNSLEKTLYVYLILKLFSKRKVLPSLSRCCYWSLSFWLLQTKHLLFLLPPRLGMGHYQHWFVSSKSGEAASVWSLWDYLQLASSRYDSSQTESWPPQMQILAAETEKQKEKLKALKRTLLKLLCIYFHSNSTGLIIRFLLFILCPWTCSYSVEIWKYCSLFFTDTNCLLIE